MNFTLQKEKSGRSNNIGIFVWLGGEKEGLGVWEIWCCSRDERTWKQKNQKWNMHLKSEGGREVKPGGREDEGVRESRVRHSLASLSFWWHEREKESNHVCVSLPPLDIKPILSLVNRTKMLKPNCSFWICNRLKISTIHNGTHTWLGFVGVIFVRTILDLLEVLEISFDNLPWLALPR